MKIALVAQHAIPVPSKSTSKSTEAGQAAEDVRLRELSRSLAANGHRVTLYAQKPDGGAPDHAKPHPGVRVEYIGPVASRDEPALLRRVADFSRPLCDRWQRERPDVVHALRWTSGLASLAAARDLAIPVVQSFNSLGVAERRHHVIARTAGIERIRLEPAIGRSASAVIARNSGELADLTRLGVPRRSITVVPWGVDTGQFTPEGPAAKRSKRPRLVTVPQPGGHLDTLLETLSRLPGTELVVVGGSPADDAHAWPTALAESLEVADRVIFAGLVGRSALPALLRSADLLVSTEEYLPSGTACLEAMACGTPVVACAADGSLEDIVIDGTTGIVVPPGSAALLAKRIRELLGQPMLLGMFGAAAADRARSRFSWDRITRETLAVYHEAVAALWRRSWHGKPSAPAAPNWTSCPTTF
jgi:glycosyltransferase involved in cell wall biosynthesis